MENLEKARKITDAIIKLDYGGNLKNFQDENGYDEEFATCVYFWLEDGNGDDRNVDQCRLLYEL